MKADIFEGYEAIFGQGKLPRKICDWYISKRCSGKKKVVNLSLCKAFWIVFLFAPLWVIWQPFKMLFNVVLFLWKNTVEILFRKPSSWILGVDITKENAPTRFGLSVLMMVISFSLVCIGIFWINFLMGNLHWNDKDSFITFMELVGLIGSFFFAIAGFSIFFIHNSSFFKLLKVRIKAFKDKVCPLVLKYNFEDDKDD